MLSGDADRGVGRKELAMIVPLTVNDFLRRAELVYGDRVGVIDEPNQPAESWGSLTYGEIAARARAQAAALDDLGSAPAHGLRSSARTPPACTRSSSG